MELLNDSDFLWVKVIKEEYIKHDIIVIDDLREHHQVSNAWRGMVQAKPIVEGGARSLVGNGVSIHF